MIPIIFWTILSALDAVPTWIFGRNTEYGLLFRNLTDSAWKFWPARIGFFLAVAVGCEWWKAIYPSNTFLDAITPDILWGFALGFQTFVIWNNFCRGKK